MVNTKNGLNGPRGQAYTYILAGNGLFLETETPLLRAHINLAQVQVRGLAPLESLLELRHGKIPGYLLSLAQDSMSADSDREMYAAIVWEGDRYGIVFPEQERSAGHVTYDTISRTVVGIHSHGRMGAFFSSTDDQDDQGFWISVVLGHTGELFPQAKARLCIYGYFSLINLSHIFEGNTGVLEMQDA